MKRSLQRQRSLISDKDISLMFKSLKATDLIEIKRNNVREYSIYCSQAHLYFSNQELWRLTQEIIKLDIKERIKEEVEIIMRMTQNLKFFQELNQKQKNVENKLHEKIASKLYYEFFNQGEIIFRQNDPPDKFYIIMKGAVNIYLIKSHQQIIQAQEDHNAKLINQYFKQYSTMDIDEKLGMLATQKIIRSLSGGIDPKQMMNSLDFFFDQGAFKHNFLLTLQEGNMFGELGILLNKSRAASIIAQQDTELAVLDSKYYLEILNKIQLHKIQQRIQFFLKHFFQGMSEKFALKYCYNFNKVKYTKGDVIYTEGSKPLSIYLIKYGEIKLVKNFEIHQSVDHEFNLYNSQKKYRKIELFCIGEGQVFGEIELVEEQLRQNTAICVAEKTKVFQLSYQVFKIIQRDNANLRQSIEKIIHSKKEWEKQRLEFLNSNMNQNGVMQRVDKNIQSFNQKMSEIFSKEVDFKPQTPQYIVKRKKAIQKKINENEKEQIPLQNNFIKNGLLQPESSRTYLVKDFRKSESSKKMQRNNLISLLGTPVSKASVRQNFGLTKCRSQIEINQDSLKQAQSIVKQRFFVNNSSPKSDLKLKNGSKFKVNRVNLLDKSQIIFNFILILKKNRKRKNRVGYFLLLVLDKEQFLRIISQLANIINLGLNDRNKFRCSKDQADNLVNEYINTQYNKIFVKQKEQKKLEVMQMVNEKRS